MSESERIATDAHTGLVRLLARTDAAPQVYLGAAWENRRVTDILTHLRGWHLLFQGWMLQDRAGRIPEYPAPGHTWERLELLNDQIFEAHRHLEYAEAREQLAESHARTVEIVRGLDDAALTDPAAYRWLGGETLGAVAHECLAAHYAWGERILDAAGVA